jgi:hypothetical protein
VAHLLYMAHNAKAIIISATPGPTGVWEYSQKEDGWVMASRGDGPIQKDNLNK